MRLHSLIWLLLLLPSSLAGQAGGHAGRWVLGIGADALRFSGGIRDTVAPSEMSATLSPSGRLGIRVALARDFGSWEAALEAGWAGGHAVGSNSVIAIEDRTSDVNRYRLALWAGVRVLPLGPGEIEVAGGPTLDRWTIVGEDRWRLGGETQVRLQVSLGRVEWENRVSFGASPSPFISADGGEEFDSGTQWALSFGAGLRFGL